MLSPDAYGRGELRIEAPYLPFCEFEFLVPSGQSPDQSSDRTPGTDLSPVSLIVSPADRTWTVASRGRRLTNYDMPNPDRTLSLCQKKVR